MNARLYQACSVQNTPLIHSLLAKGANVDYQAMPHWSVYYQDETLLLRACRTRNLNAVDALLEAGADVNLPRRDSMTPLMLSACLKDEEMMGMLLDAGADVHAVRAHDHQSALLLAVQNQSLECVETLVKEKEVDVDARDKHGYSPLLMACLINHPIMGQIAQCLVQWGADVHQVEADSGRTLLMAAANADAVDVARVLLDHGVDAELEDLDERTALDWATPELRWYSQVKVPRGEVRRLLEKVV